MDRNSNLVNRHNRVGGQAVIEGVMMKNSERVSLAVRKEDGSIEIKNTEVHSPRKKFKLFDKPIIRGIIAFFESLVLSFKTLSHSTDMLDLEEDKKNGKKNVIDNINIHINSGETVGIIGGTGSAKTTLVQMIPRLYDVTEGVVKVGGRPVGDYTLKNLRDSVAMVLQVNLLFSGTIEENLRWGNKDATMEEIENACKIAQAHDFITSFPDGYQTNLGQGGVNLSGGQKQRLCIARALLKSPKVLILDDSTSAVDTATDAKIREGFRANHGDITTIIVAQRISSVQHADKIIVLDDGKINAIGTHDELLDTNEIYTEVYKSQQEGGEE